ncbi:MAG: Hsp20/alpha crystallin family protein [Rhodoferax sp.]|nr:Hsp20/alpha crystallin family protein [Rhodoferax sp.]
MFFATTTPAFAGRHAFRPTGRSLERFLDEARQVNRQQACGVEQDEKSYTLTFDVPGITREQLTIGIEGSVVRIQSKDDAPRKYRAAYELPIDLDVANSQAKLENGVLTLKLAKRAPVNTVTELAIS